MTSPLRPVQLPQVCEGQIEIGHAPRQPREGGTPGMADGRGWEGGGDPLRLGLAIGNFIAAACYGPDGRLRER